MKRAFWNTLQAWKKASERKPLLVQGARQVGKTWILKEFGRVEFQSSFRHLTAGSHAAS